MPLYGYLVASWNSSLTSNFNGFQLEGRTGTDAFLVVPYLSQNLIPPDMTSLDITLAPGAETEGSDLQYRICAVAGTQKSPYSEIATLRAGVRPPSPLSGNYATGGVTVYCPGRGSGPEPMGMDLPLPDILIAYIYC